MRIENDILVIGSMSQEKIKLIQDLTNQAIQESQYFSDFPKDLQILQARLVNEPDGWGGKECRIIIEYQFNGTKYKISRIVFSNVKDVLIDLLFEIVDHYRRCHLS